MANSRLFISWSRSQASAIAPFVRTFCQDVLGIEDIFLSKEIDSGRRWSDEIADALETCNAGLIIVTQENKGAPWLNFEAGAISKRVADANVIPLLWDISVGDIADTPLNQFQSKSFSKDDLLFVMRTLAELWEISGDSVTRRFDAMWPTLEERLKGISSAENEPQKTVSIQDLYGLIQRLSSRLSGIELAIENMDGRVAAGIFGQSEFATASPQRAAELVAPHLSAKSLQRNALSHFTADDLAFERKRLSKRNALLESALLRSQFSEGQKVSHAVYGIGHIDEVGDETALVIFDGELHEVGLEELD